MTKGAYTSFILNLHLMKFQILPLMKIFFPLKKKNLPQRFKKNPGHTYECLLIKNLGCFYDFLYQNQILISLGKGYFLSLLTKRDPF